MGNSITDDSGEQKKRIKRYYYKNVNLFNIIERIKLWPSRNGLLHGVKIFTVKGNYAEIITHCNEKIIIKKSKNSRATRWLRNKWFVDVCPKCKVPLWKLEKYGTTSFNKHWGSQLSTEFNKIRSNGGEVDNEKNTSKNRF